jgi:Flp pilus assembly pilin Flp
VPGDSCRIPVRIRIPWCSRCQPDSPGCGVTQDRARQIATGFSRHWIEILAARIRHRHSAQDLVEYGLIVAVVAVIGVIGLSTFGAAQAGYFGGLQSNLAPTVARTGNVRHRTTLTLQPCTPQPPTAGTTVYCDIVVQDTSAISPRQVGGLTPPAPPTGNVTWILTDSSGPYGPFACSPLISTLPDSSRCSLSFQPTMAGTVVLLATYNPDDPSLFLISSGDATITIQPAPTPTSTPSP